MAGSKFVLEANSDTIKGNPRIQHCEEEKPPHEV